MWACVCVCARARACTVHKINKRSHLSSVHGEIREGGKGSFQVFDVVINIGTLKHELQALEHKWRGAHKAPVLLILHGQIR
jgi:hypothetical protein